MGFVPKPGDISLAAPLDVPYVAQKRQQSCWYACAKMLYQWRHGADAKVKHAIVGTEAGASVHAHMQKSGKIGDPEEGVGATEKEWPAVAAAFGLTPLPQDGFNLLDQSPDALGGVIRNHGPLWCAGRFFQGGAAGGHVIVVLGVISRKQAGRAQPCVVFHDPGPKELQGGPFCVKQFDTYFKLGAKNKGLFSFAETEGVSPVMFIA